MPTAINWPAELSGIRLDQQSFRLDPGQKKIEATFQSGRSYSKLVPVQTPDRFSGYLSFSYDNLQIFDRFWKQTLNEATKSFNWHHPITDARIEVKILGTPVYSPIGGNHYRAECSFEIVGEV